MVTSLLSAPRDLAATALGLATRVRGARVFHPDGRAWTCRVTADGGAGVGATLLDEPGVHEGVARRSRGVGLPRPLPDVEGLALRLPGLGRDGEPFDLLVNSAWRYTFAPAVLAPVWSAVLPHRTEDDRLVLLGAQPVDRDRFRLLHADPFGPWRPWGRLDLLERLDDDEAAALRFRPTVGADDLRQVEPFFGLRRRAYEESQARR